GEALLALVKRDFGSAKKILSSIKPPEDMAARHYIKIANVYMDHLRDHRSAENFYKKALEYMGRGEDAITAMVRLAEIKLLDNDDKNAYEYFQKALSESPGNITIYMEIVDALIRNKKYEMAERYIDEMERGKSKLKWGKRDLNTAFLRFAYSYMLNGDDEDAVRIIEKAKKIDPGAPPLGEILLMFPEDRKLARKFYEKSVEMYPDEALPWFYLGFLLEEEGNRKKAETCYKESKKGLRSPGDIDYHRAWVYSLRRNRSAAIESLRTSCEKDIFNACRAYSDTAFDWMRDEPFFREELPELIKQVKAQASL
ncbi:MAG: hypothetical protein J7M18_07010, partial [Candidatus Eremiobacteraeota bacterium]|nr:hypothetical protein [Candidatus Eremiobacteraeota bacterium]